MEIRQLNKHFKTENIYPNSWRGPEYIQKIFPACSQTSTGAIAAYLASQAFDNPIARVRLIRKMLARGVITPTTHITQKLLLTHEVEYDRGQLYALPHTVLASLTKLDTARSARCTKREELTLRRFALYQKIFNAAFDVPSVKIEKLTIGNATQPPQIAVVNTQYYRDYKVNITVSAGWENVGKFNTQEYLPAKILFTEVEEDITLHKCLAWSKQAIRKAVKSGDLSEIPLKEMWVGTNGTVHNVTTQRHMALSGIKTRTRNKVSNMLWDD